MVEQNNFDVVVIGGGSAGFSAAIRGGELGKSVVLIEGRTMGEGTSVNIGCVPSKFIISEAFSGTNWNNIKEDRDNGQLMGAEIIAKDAGNMIQNLTVAIKARMTIEDLVDTYFPYLTVVEGIKLGALVFSKDEKQLSCCAG